MEYMKKDFGNPSSLHRLGVNAERGIKNARKEMAMALGTKPEEIIFTSGGTEADNTAILGTAAARKRRGNKIITTVIEHPAVLETVKRLESQGNYVVEYIGVDEKGNVDLDGLKQA